MYTCPECGSPMYQDYFNGMYLCENVNCPHEGCYVSRYTLERLETI
jgi:uncharacterized Zn finger protein (UPF0148 family)